MLDILPAEVTTVEFIPTFLTLRVDVLSTTLLVLLCQASTIVSRFLHTPADNENMKSL